MTPDEIVDQLVKDNAAFMERMVHQGKLERGMRQFTEAVFNIGRTYEAEQITNKFERIYLILHA